MKYGSWGFRGLKRDVRRHLQAASALAATEFSC
jgi:hypothetical protein